MQSTQMMQDDKSDHYVWPCVKAGNTKIMPVPCLYTQAAVCRNGLNKKDHECENCFQVFYIGQTEFFMNF